jgi:hypothetical protein
MTLGCSAYGFSARRAPDLLPDHDTRNTGAAPRASNFTVTAEQPSGADESANAAHNWTGNTGKRRD